MRVTSNVNNITPINKTSFCGVTRIPNQQKVASFVSCNKEIYEVLDSNITKFIDSNPIDIVKKFSLSKILKNSLSEITKSENLINEGCESKVYKISDNYVLKLRRDQDIKKAISLYDVPYCPNKKFTEIECYYGEPIVKLGKTEILKNAMSHGNSIHCGTKFNSLEPPTSLDIEKYNTEYLPLCASLSQESFNEFAQSLKQMNGIKKWGYPNALLKPKSRIPKKVSFIPDIANPNNILIAGGKFKIVDKLEATTVNEPNTFWTMVEPLLLRYTPFSYAKYDTMLRDTRREIFKKCVYASEKAGLSFKQNEVVDSRMKEFLKDILGDNDGVYIDYSFNYLNQMRQGGENLEKRLKILEELFNKI